MANTSLVDTRSNLPTQNTPRVNVISAVALLVPLGLGILSIPLTNSLIGAIVGLLLGLLGAQAPKIARQWERAVVLRLGRYVGLRGPGLFWIIPFVDTVPAWIDQRVITTSTLHEECSISDFDTDPRTIPGALRFPGDPLAGGFDGIPRDREVILYCT